MSKKQIKNDEQPTTNKQNADVAQLGRSKSEHSEDERARLRDREADETGAEERLRSSVVEQRYRKPLVVSSTLTVGSKNKLNDYPMGRSRIKYHLKQQSTRNIFFALTGIIVIFILIMMFGMDFLINFSLFVKKTTSGKDLHKNDLTYIAPPVLDPMSEATKSAKITVSGYAQDKQTIKLFVNGKLVDKTEVNKNKQFVFKDVEIEKGSNEIKTKAQTADDKESDYSTAITINYIDNPPALDISSPQDGQSVPKAPLKVSGKTDPGVKVTVNDFWAITDDAGNFSYTLTLHDGDNSVKIVATDDAGNTTTKELTVHPN